MEIFDLRTEHQKNPIGIDKGSPLFSWKVRSESADAYTPHVRIIVASAPSLLVTDFPDLWDSGLLDGKAFCVRYAGKPLCSRTEYYWLAECDGIRSPVAKFETAYLSDPMPRAFWIGMPLAYSGATSVFRLDFTPRKQIFRARLYLAALGCSRVYLNGALLKDAYFDGAISVYSERVFYRTYPLSFTEGNNALCVELGYGFYGAKKLKGEVVVEYADGEVLTLPTFEGRLWNVTRGCVTENSIYGGEVYDARRGRKYLLPEYRVSTSEFVAAYREEAPAGRLCACPIPPMEVVRSFAPFSVVRSEQGLLSVDAGENLCGWLHMRLSGERGARVTVRYGEILNSSGRLNTANLRTADNRDVYILSGEGTEEYSPAFTYHGFRYAEISVEGKAEIEELLVCQLRTAVDRVGEFSCSDERLNGLHAMAVRSEGANLNGVFTDCPQRDERLGWLNDMSSRVFESVCNFDLCTFLPNFVDMITDSQDETGAFGDTVPFLVGSMVADAVDAYPLLGILAYRFYGDKRVLERNYEGFCRWNDRLAGFARDGVVEWSLYGDWCPAFRFSEGGDGTHSAQVDKRFMGGAYYLWNLKLTAECAEILGKAEEAQRWRNRWTDGVDAFLKRWLKGETLGNGSQTECAVGLTLFADKRDLCRKWAESAAADLKAQGYHTTCGNQGYRHLLYRLAEYGFADDLCRLLTNPKYPGWGYMLASGATTVWERWEAEAGTDMHSYNHPMFAAYDGFFYNYLAGIRTDLCENTFGKIVIEPCFTTLLDHVEAKMNTVRGEISVRWERSDKGVSLRVATPANTELTVRARGKQLEFGEKKSCDELRLGNGTFEITVCEIVDTEESE